MQLKKYNDYLKMAKDAIDNATRPFKVKREEKALELKIIELESSIADENSKLQEMLTSKNSLLWDSIVEYLDIIAIKERKLKQLNELKEQLF